jgi:hypothetical protein
MSDLEPIQTKKPFGFLRDGDGDFSSGRLIKVGAFFMLSLIAVVAESAFIIALFEGKIDGGTFVSLTLGLGGILSGIALGSEITQKATGT